jgi:hypothetical protein
MSCDEYTESLKKMNDELNYLIKNYEEETTRGIRDGKACEALVNFFKENSKGVTMRDYL